MDAVNLDSDDNLAKALDANINVSHLRVVKPRKAPRVSAEVGSKLGNLQSVKGKPVNAELLAKRWGIDQRKALNTVRMTTQRGVRTVLHPSLSKRYPTNDRMLRYKRLPHPVFTDTMFAGRKSAQGNKCAQVFCTQYGWTRVHPMKSKSEAHEALSLVFS